MSTASGLIPMYDEDYEEKRKLKMGKIYMADIKELRNVKFHRLYFALISCAWAFLNEQQQAFFKDDMDKFRKTVEVAAGNYDLCYSLARREWVEIPKSISFNSMDELEFSELYEKVKDILYKVFLTSINKEEFENQLRYF